MSLTAFLRGHRTRRNPGRERAAFLLPHAPQLSELGDEALSLPPPPESAAFRRWFDGSVVVDDHGAPRVVFHGTRSPVDFTVFETGGRAEDTRLITSSRDPSAFLGPHFTESLRVAGRFARGRAATWDRTRYIPPRPGALGGRVIPVYLAIRHPAEFDGDRALFDWILAHGQSNQLDEAIEMDAAGDLDDDDDDAAREAHYADPAVRAEALERLEEGGGSDFDDSDPYDDALQELGMSAAEVLRAAGHDGLRYWNDVEGGGWTWVPLGAGQVKSALANRGTFDPASDSLLD